MFFSLDVRRARKGDCLLLHFGTKEDPGLIVIDGGPRRVYAPHLKPRLQKLRRDRVSGPEPLAVDLLMVSHVDDDHIQGILDLTGELIEDANSRRPQLAQVLSFWHNSFETIIGQTPKELTASLGSKFPTASLAGELPAEATLDDDLFETRPEEEVIVDTLKVLASIDQGARLRSNAERLEFPLNPEVDGGLILAPHDAGAFDLGRGLTFTVVGPLKPELAALHKKHQEWLVALRTKGLTPPAALAAYVDKSVPNLSSIVVLAEAGQKRMLLTGDARGDKILEGLELVGLLAKGGTMHVELLKVPHHGSANNLEKGFFERITADHYVFSGDGEHGNPERESLQMLLDARGEQEEFTIHLTYPLDELDAGRKDDWNKERNKEQKRQETKPGIKVRKAWSPKEHSLTAFFEDHPTLGGKVKIVSEDPQGNAPHIVNLLDPVGF